MHHFTLRTRIDLIENALNASILDETYINAQNLASHHFETSKCDLTASLLSTSGGISQNSRSYDIDDTVYRISKKVYILFQTQQTICNPKKCLYFFQVSVTMCFHMMSIQKVTDLMTRLKISL